MTGTSSSAVLIPTLVALLVGALGAGAAAGEHEDFFERVVRPLLVDNCFECHGPDVGRPKGGLAMTGRDALLAGGDLGPAVVPGDVEARRLIAAVRWTNHELEMPPRQLLAEREVLALERWVAAGAVWPGGAEGVPAAGVHEPGIDLESGRQWWSYRPVVRPPVPDVAAADAVANPIDAFVVARLEAAGLAPGPPATRREQLRRASFDLTGLPPDHAEVQAFEADTSPDAWATVLDRLLDSPAYGERWGRHWLDLVRFAQTNGYERDQEKPAAWRYRDWVVDALNRDLPYDRFLLEQLAGDELPDGDSSSLVATGMYRVGAWDVEPDDGDQAVYDSLDDTLRVVTEGFLATTLGCARCHDHKFDPLPQADYYGLLAFFGNIARYEEPPRYAKDSRMLAPLGLTPAVEAEWERRRAEQIEGVRDEIRELLGAYEAELSADAPEEALPEDLDVVDAEAVAAGGGNLSRLPREVRRAAYVLRDEIRQLRDSFEGDLDWALVVRETGQPPQPMRLLHRGKVGSPGDVVPAHFVQALCPDEASAFPDLGRPARGLSSTGRRRQLGEWIASADNPLTARVMVNRVWQGHFGRGLVATPSDFGTRGALPTHPELLDWLAAEFVAQGWSLKALHRLVLSSHTYRQSSRAPQPAAQALDPDNTLLWRQTLRRLEAEALRDAMLAAAGNLDRSMGGRGFFPLLSRQVLAGGSRPGEGWEVSRGADQDRRSLYAYVKRSLPVPLLETFDMANTSLPVGRRTVTNIAPQALLLLNGEFSGRQAEAFAERLAESVPGGEQAPAEALVDAAFRAALARSPTDDERALAAGLLDTLTADFAGRPPPLTFAARVPSRLDEAFLDGLVPEDVLFWPRRGWTYVKGAWGVPYNGTLALDLTRGAGALSERTLGDGTLRARLVLAEDADVCALVLRGDIDGDVITGLELRLDPRSDRLALVRLPALAAGPRRHAVDDPADDGADDADADATVGDAVDAAQELAACGVEWTPGAVHELVVTLDGPRVSVSVGPRPTRRARLGRRPELRRTGAGGRERSPRATRRRTPLAPAAGPRVAVRADVQPQRIPLRRLRPDDA